ncbi:nucleotidyltransferase substrate binding protein [Psychrobium sp. nBUS_13]|uniref:nucleotidyltransferase substrate binding protein n=1 Tax=Psychrobium sp. nBUS_13 TaxID=3395319 RepID=UPI003EB722E0
MKSDIRWQQRLQNYSRALAQLTEAVELLKARELSNIEKQGFVKAFEFTHELSWNVMKDFAIYQGEVRIIGSRDATRHAFKNDLITNGEAWMDMIIARNKAVHSYDEKTVMDVIDSVVTVYYPLFVAYQEMMQGLINE